MPNEEKLISLKEAAAISGYSSDYIGQLIRGGKIFGKQVYYNVAWMTTKEAVMSYKSLGESKKERFSMINWLKEEKRKLLLEWQIIQLFFQTFKHQIPIFLSIIIFILVIILYLVYVLSPGFYRPNLQQDSQQNEKAFSF